MLQTIESFFGASPNIRCGELLKKLGGIAVECAAHVKRSNATSLAEVIEFEHRADATVRETHELLDAAFILRFDKGDVTQLLGELDDIVDGMRKVATHVSLYHPRLAKPSSHAKELLDTVEVMVKDVAQLISALIDKKTPIADIVAQVYSVSEHETRADEIFARAERQLVEDHGDKPLTLDFTAQTGMLELLEMVTDHANHCARLILSMARKEA
jgi:uncharacterized protein Yka (UPF0111/DUF47 family)